MVLQKYGNDEQETLPLDITDAEAVAEVNYTALLVAVLDRYGTAPRYFGATYRNPGVKTEKTAKKREKTGQKRARYGLRKKSAGRRSIIAAL